MQKSKLTSKELRTTGELMIQIPGHEDLGYALLELVEYRSRERKLFACSRVDRMAIPYTDPDILETHVKNELARMMAQKVIEDELVTFSQSFDRKTNELIFRGEVTILKGADE